MTNKEKIESLLIRGFTSEEISKILNIDKSEVDKVKISDNLTDNSCELYSELQRDLAKVVIKERAKDSPDNAVILNSIKLHYELQERKLQLNKIVGKTESKVDKKYIYERDEEISKLIESGVSEEEIANNFNISVLSVRNSLDRVNLGLPEELKNLSPTIISETKGLDKKTRLKILNNAYANKLTRSDVRTLVNDIKNNSR